MITVSHDFGDARVRMTMQNCSGVPVIRDEHHVRSVRRVHLYPDPVALLPLSSRRRAYWVNRVWSNEQDFREAMQQLYRELNP
jgi:hypothetical protein